MHALYPRTSTNFLKKKKSYFGNKSYNCMSCGTNFVKMIILYCTFQCFYHFQRYDMILLMFFYQVDPTSSCCFYKEIPLSIWKMRNGSKVKKKKSKTGAWGEPLLLQFILCIPSFFLLCRVQTKTRMQHVLHRFAYTLFTFYYF